LPDTTPSLPHGVALTTRGEAPYVPVQPVRHGGGPRRGGRAPDPGPGPRAALRRVRPHGPRVLPVRDEPHRRVPALRPPADAVPPDAADAAGPAAAVQLPVRAVGLQLHLGPVPVQPELPDRRPRV